MADFDGEVLGQAVSDSTGEAAIGGVDSVDSVVVESASTLDFFGEVTGTGVIFESDHQVPMFDGELVINGISVVRPTVYLYQAADTITSVVYTWMLTFRDFTGTGYPGPNAPVEVSIVATLRL